jgi:Na+-driven multidrug efflux pump
MEGVNIVTEVAQYGITGVAIALVVALFLTIKLFIGVLVSNYELMNKFTLEMQKLQTEIKLLRVSNYTETIEESE